MSEETRIEAVQAIMDGRLTVTQAATALNLSERQVYRALAAARERGLAGLVHGNRGRTPWNKGDEALRKSVLRLARKRYTDVNDRHLQELLEREHSLSVHREARRRRLRGNSTTSSASRSGGWSGATTWSASTGWPCNSLARRSTSRGCDVMKQVPPAQV